MSNITDLKTNIKDLRTKFWALKSKKAKDKVRENIRKLEQELSEALLDGIKPYLNIRHNGIIVCGGTDCLARTEFGLIPVYAVNDRMSKSWYESTCCVSYNDGDKITFEIKHPHVINGVLNWFAAEVEGGTFDEAKYKELCKQDNLAFFKKPDGSMTGLFK